jgi:Cft2 family RNA processing exonuclease
MNILILTKNKIVIGLLLVCLLINTYSCSPKLKYFPKQIDSNQFETYSKINSTPTSKMWELDTSKEYYLETSEYIDEERLINIIKKSLKKERYRIVKKKGFVNCIIGKRNFFNRGVDKTRTIICVYYQSMPNKFRSQVFIKYKINKENKSRLVKSSLNIGKYIFYPNRAKTVGEKSWDSKMENFLLDYNSKNG